MTNVNNLNHSGQGFVQANAISIRLVFIYLLIHSIIGTYLLSTISIYIHTCLHITKPSVLKALRWQSLSPSANYKKKITLPLCVQSTVSDNDSYPDCEPHCVKYLTREWQPCARVQPATSQIAYIHR